MVSRSVGLQKASSFLPFLLPSPPSFLSSFLPVSINPTGIFSTYCMIIRGVSAALKFMKEVQNRGLISKVGYILDTHLKNKVATVG